MEDENGNSYGNTVNTHREVTLNGSFNLVKLYNHVPFLKKVNEKFNRTMSRSQYERKKQEKEKKKKDARELAADPKKALPKNRKAFEKEITLLPDTSFNIRHGKNSKRLIVSAKTADGKLFPIKYKRWTIIRLNSSPRWIVPRKSRSRYWLRNRWKKRVGIRPGRRWLGWR